MYYKIVWCYVFVLTLLDISLNTKLSAQGKSHGVTVHDSLIEGITFQEWGKEEGAEGGGGGARAGRAVAAGALQLWPPALDFGRAALAAAHALTVTLTNTANTTMHLASVAGTTPDFHASFFDSKTLPPQANTTFSVVYLGRREGPVAAHLYIHTSLGVHKYPVSAVGVASEWGVWPLVGVRVPLNATVEPLLTLHNPTDETIQVSEVYSSGAWLGLALPGGAQSAPRAAWAVPPRTARPLVRLRLAPPPTAHHPLTAYVRIKANITGGGLVVCVEARSVPSSEYVSPLQLRLRTRGSRDPPDVFDIAVGNSAAASVSLEASVWAARCAASPLSPPAPPDAAHAPPTANGQSDRGTANGNGVKSDGVHVALLRPHLEPHQQLTRAVQLTLDYAALWAGYVGGARGAGAWCAGWVRVGRALLPYSLQLLPGTLRLSPPQLHFVTASRDDALRMRDVRVRNEFPVPLHIARIDRAPDVDTYFEVESLAPVVLGGGAGALVARVRMRDTAAPAQPLRALLTLRTNLTDYSLPLLLYSGRLRLEWEWPNSEDGSLRLGVLGTSSTRRVAAVLHNPAPAALCVTDHALDLPGATLALLACAHHSAPPPHHACRCVAAGGRAGAVLTLVAPAREGAVRGAVSLWAAAPQQDAPPALTRAPVSLRVLQGRVQALPLQLPRAAPYAWASAPLVLESSMALRMVLLGVTLPDDDALSFEPSAGAEVTAGRHTVGTVVFAPEKLCEPNCYTGLDLTTDEGAAWLRRAHSAEAEWGAALRADGALRAARRAVFRRAAAAHNVSLYAHTQHAVQLEARGAAAAWWPRAAAASARAGLAPVAHAVPFTVRVRNPSASHALLLQPVIAAPLSHDGEAEGEAEWEGEGEGGSHSCAACSSAPHAFALVQWRAVRGLTRPHRPDPALPHPPAPLLLLAPAADLDLALTFTPPAPADLAAVLYLRNNLTIMESVLLTGRGAYPSFELGGRRPGTDAPLLFEVSECGGTVRRTVVARNTGQVGVRLREWHVAGQPCQARGFRLTPCAPLTLAPNESRPLTLAFTPDYTLARVVADLSARAGRARAAFPLRAVAPARLLARCQALAPRPPWEPAARAAVALLALAALALVLAAAALDAERELRRARAARPPPAPRRPLDLRALAERPPPAAPVPRRPPPRRRRTPRAPQAPLDPHAERRAFERWRNEVLGRADDDDERSSDEPQPPVPDAEVDIDVALDSEVPEAHERRAVDGYEADPETEDRPQGSGDDDAVSTGSGTASASSSSPTVDDRDEAEEGDEPESILSDERSAPIAGDESPVGSAARADAAAASPAPPGRARRDAADTPRRASRSRTAEGGAGAREPGARSSAAKHHARKDKPCKRLRSRPAASPPRSSPPRADARAPGLRWGASWSSVVAARSPAPALAPIGSDVRRRAEPERALAAGDHSLFYFNGDAAHSNVSRDSDFSWRPPPPVERPAFAPARDFLAEETTAGSGVGAVGSGSFRSLNSVWGSSLEPRPAAAAWLWGGYAEGGGGAGGALGASGGALGAGGGAMGAGGGALGAGGGALGAVRPPPGFGAAARAVRPYDPFRSLASIWAPGALDWRGDADAEPDTK